MPLFLDSELLFVHIPKNAGRSIELALLEGKGSPDGGRRQVLNRMAHLLQRLTRSKFAEKNLIGTIDVSLAAQHLTYSEMQLLDLIPETVKFSFAVKRNPYDRAVSSISHFLPDLSEHSELQDQRDFERCLAKWLDMPAIDHNVRAHKRLQADFILDSRGRTVVDKVLAFEHLNEEFEVLLAQFKSDRTALPWTGKSTRRDLRESIYSQSSKRMVQKYYEEDFDILGYPFGWK